ADGPPVGGPAPATGGPPGPAFPDGPALQWAGAADAGTLYATALACPDLSCPKTVHRLAGSDDGGRTWTSRGGQLREASLTVLDRRTLVAVSDTGVGAAAVSISRDGGRSWASVRRQGRIVPALPPGGALVCVAKAAGQPCTGHALDPAAGQLRPLADSPTLADVRGSVVAPVGRHLWLAGTEPASGRPIVAVSADRGRSWARHTFPCAAGACAAPGLAVAPGGAQAYALLPAAAGDGLVAYRGTAAGVWSPVAGADAVPYDQQLDPPSPAAFVTRDGTLVVVAAGERERDEPRPSHWAHTGGTFRPVTLRGLPLRSRPPERTATGYFLALSYSDGTLYGSADGRAWAPLTRR
ncbi:MAG TPA: hypothetical protein VES42_27070, partial [Pilimelia sp.]|nr:hypothetical protein [Pilimelia sp.]